MCGCTSKALGLHNRNKMVLDVFSSKHVYIFWHIFCTFRSFFASFPYYHIAFHQQKQQNKITVSSLYMEKTNSFSFLPKRQRLFPVSEDRTSCSTWRHSGIGLWACHDLGCRLSLLLVRFLYSVISIIIISIRWSISLFFKKQYSLKKNAGSRKLIILLLGNVTIRK